MAAGNWKLYNTAKLKLGQGLIQLNSHTFKCALFLASGNADTLTHDELSDLTGEVPNGNGYTTGGVTLTGVTWTNSSGTIKFDCDDFFWDASGLGFDAAFAVIYDDTVSGDPLICVCVLDGGADVEVPALKELHFTINSGGVFTLSGGNTN